MTAPAHRSMPKTPVNDRLWSALLAADQPLTIGELADDLGAMFQAVHFRLDVWVGAGLVASAGRRPRRFSLLESTERTPMPPIVDRHGCAIPRLPAGYQRLWAAMRVLKTFDRPLLRMAAQTNERSTMGYLGLLQRVGYVRLDRVANTRRGECSRYSLIRDTGRRAPRETIMMTAMGQRRELVDPNTGERHDISRGTPSKRRAYKTDPVVAGGEG